MNERGMEVIHMNLSKIMPSMTTNKDRSSLFLEEIPFSSSNEGNLCAKQN